MTIAGTVFDTINDNWGSGGYGGAAPAIDTTETQTAHDETTTDVVEVRHYTLRETGDQRNDTYVNRHYSIDVYISSKTSNAQLKLLHDEVEYLLRNTAMTGLQLESIDKDWKVSQWEQGRHSVVLRVRVLAPLSDGAVTSAAGVTASMQALLMYGSANAAWIPMTVMGGQINSYWWCTDARIINYGADDFNITFMLALPTNKGSLKLYLKSLKFALFDADAGDYVSAVVIEGVSGVTGRVEIDTDPTDYTSTGDKTFAGTTFPAAVIDCSSYDSIYVEFSIIATNANDLDLQNVRMQCYYA